MQTEQVKYPMGIKWTKQRKCVYDVLMAAKEPLNAHQIYNIVMKNISERECTGVTEGSYAVSTIYRILTAFEEKNLVAKSNGMDSGTFVYELNRGQHTHYAVCLSCHKHVPMKVCPLEHDHFQQEPGDFQVTGHKLELYGYCRDCQVSNLLS